MLIPITANQRVGIPLFSNCTITRMEGEEASYNDIESGITKSISDVGTITAVYAALGEDFLPNGYGIILLSNGDISSCNWEKGRLINLSYLIRNDLLYQIWDNELNEYNEVVPEQSVLSRDSGNRFEGYIYQNAPSGIGKYYDEQNNLVYEGVMINWEREGFGISYYDNGVKEYEGMWCHGKYCGKGTIFDRHGKSLYTCYYINGEKWEPSYSNLSIDTTTSFTHLSSFVEEIVLNIRIHPLDELIFDYCYNLKNLIVQMAPASIGWISISGLEYLEKIVINKNCFKSFAPSWQVIRDREVRRRTRLEKKKRKRSFTICSRR